MKILITGGSGLLGQYLNISLTKDNEILTLYNEHMGNCSDFNSTQADITNYNLMSEIISSFRPAVIVHTAAISRTEQVNLLLPENVVNINVTATKQIAELSDSYKVKLIYTSTDLVYDGDAGCMLNESAPLKPASFYAKTKLEGEQSIIKTFDNYVILRTALLYGIGLNDSLNHFHNMYNNLRQNKEVKLFYDQFRTPLSLKNATEIIKEIICKDINKEVINFGGKDRVSRYELGEIFCELSGLNKELLIKTSMYDFKNMPHVADVSMDTKKLNSYEIEQMSMDQSIKEILFQINQ